MLSYDCHVTIVWFWRLGPGASKGRPSLRAQEFRGVRASLGCALLPVTLEHTASFPHPELNTCPRLLSFGAFAWIGLQVEVDQVW